MNFIRQSTIKDISRIAEILVFTRRMNYRSIFQNDKVSFGEIQVLPIIEEFQNDVKKLNTYWIYEDNFIKGIINIDKDEIKELYVEHFFQNEGVGSSLIDFAITQQSATYLWVLEKNERAIRFYKRHGFRISKERKIKEGTSEYIIKMKL